MGEKVRVSYKCMNCSVECVISCNVHPDGLGLCQRSDWQLVQALTTTYNGKVVANNCGLCSYKDCVECKPLTFPNCWKGK